MTIRYTAEALLQLDAILDYIKQRNPQGARHVSQLIQVIVQLLADQPMAGAATDRVGQRRIVVIPYPYAVFYRVRGTEMIIQRIRHTAQRPFRRVGGP